MARGESKSGLKRPRKIIPRPRKNQTKAEQGPQNQSEVREGSHQAEEKLDVAEPRWIRSRPNRSHGTNAKSEKAHIEAEEMLDVAEVHYMCFGEFLSFLICELGMPRRSMTRLRWPSTAHGCAEHAEKGHNEAQAELRFDRTTYAPIVSVPDRGARKNPRGDLILCPSHRQKEHSSAPGTDHAWRTWFYARHLPHEIAGNSLQQDSSIGFGAPVRANMRTGGSTNAEVTSSLLESVESSDLIAYGLIPEFVGRFPILVSLSALNEDQLVQVLTEPKNSLAKQYKKMFSMNNVKLHFTGNALRLIAKKTLAKNTGARGLRAILENILTEAMFEIDKENTRTLVPEGKAFFSSEMALSEALIVLLVGFLCKVRSMHVSCDFGFHKLIIMPPSRPNDSSSWLPKSQGLTPLHQTTLLKSDQHKESSFLTGLGRGSYSLSPFGTGMGMIPDIRVENDTINAVLVDEEAVGSVDAPGCGAKILHDDDAFNQLLHEKKSGDPMGVGVAESEFLEGELQVQSEAIHL
uniref:Clp ATPase C-terminal domain-containing protein n=1 Tax=Fagus sylvatica TaxID=28930 RepID=A0A2N9G4T9_FAGSY